MGWFRNGMMWRCLLKQVRSLAAVVWTTDSDLCRCQRPLSCINRERSRMHRSLFWGWTVWRFLFWKWFLTEGSRAGLLYSCGVGSWYLNLWPQVSCTMDLMLLDMGPGLLLMELKKFGVVNSMILYVIIIILIIIIFLLLGVPFNFSVYSCGSIGYSGLPEWKGWIRKLSSAFWSHLMLGF